MKLAIAMPCRDIMPVGTAFDFARLCAYTACAGVELLMLTTPGTLIADQRERLAQQAIDGGADYILWLDADSRFPKETALRLMAHDLDIVGAIFSTRAPPFRTNAFLEHDDKPLERYCPEPGSTGLKELDALGFGLILTKTNVFTKIRDNQRIEGIDLPWFNITWINGKHAGEDTFWCAMATSAGFKIWADLDLSEECGHIGMMEFNLAHPRYENEMAAKEAKGTT